MADLLPISTPLDAGLRADDLSLAIVLAGLCAFAFGANDLVQRSAAVRRYGLHPVVCASYAALALVGLAVVVSLPGLRSIPLAQAVCVSVSAWGLVRMAMRAPSLWRWLNEAPGPEIARRALLGAAMFWTVVFWTDVFQTHVGLPVAYDGIAHTTYYLRILESGMPTLGRVPIGFAGVFGTQFFPFYPTGTHALMAATAGVWGQWGIVSHAGVLKACFTLTVAAMPWALYFFLRRVAPAMPWWVALAVAIAAIPGFRFPLEAAHEGGASRLIAHLVLLPIYAEALTGRLDAARLRVPAGLVLGVAFLMHPSVFVMLAAILLYSTIWTALESSGQRPIRLAAGFAGTLAVSGILIAGLLTWNRSVAEARDAAQVFSWHALVARWRGGWTTLFDRAYGMARVQPWLVSIGAGALVLRRRALGITWRAAAFPFWMALLALAILTAQVVSIPGARLLGGAFYDEVPRVIEVLYEAVGLCLAAVIWAICRIIPSASRPGWRRWMSAAAAAGVVTGAFAYQVSRGPWVRAHITYWDRQFSTPRIGALDGLGAWIMQHTERNALLFYKPFDSEIWEAWTGRRGIFMYGECQVNNDLEPCLARKTFVAGVLKRLAARIEHPAPGTRCLASIDAFGRPAYFLVEAGADANRALPICLDATLLTAVDGRAVVQYHKPE